MDEMPQDPAAQAAPQEGGDLMTKMDAVGKALTMVAQEMGDSPLAEQMQQILAAYADLFQKAQGGGEDAGPQMAQDIPAQQGPGGVPMGPQSRN